MLRMGDCTYIQNGEGVLFCIRKFVCDPYKLRLVLYRLGGMDGLKEHFRTSFESWYAIPYDLFTQRESENKPN